MTWRDEALCSSHPEIDWIPDTPRPLRETLANLSAARAVCAVCPVSADCLEDALTSPHTFGIRAGTIDAQRRKLRNGRPRRSRSTQAACGTEAGYHRHRRIDRTTACDECLTAHTRYVAAHRP